MNRLTREQEIASCLRRLANLIEGSVPLIEPRTLQVVAPYAAVPSMGQTKQEFTFSRPRRKTAKADTVNKLLSANKLLKSLGAKSTGVDIEALANPETSKYYLKSWKRQEDNGSYGPAGDRLMRVLHARQRELGVTFRNTTQLFSQSEADKVIEALKEVGRSLLGAKSVAHDTVDHSV